MERRLDRQDRRIVRLFLTNEGRELGERVLVSGMEFNRHLKSRLGGLDQDLIKALDIINKSID